MPGEEEGVIESREQNITKGENEKPWLSREFKENTERREEKRNDSGERAEPH